MPNLIPFILIGLFVYLIFFRKGGMGCCGGHDPRGAGERGPTRRSDPSDGPAGDVIDLPKDDYRVREG